MTESFSAHTDTHVDVSQDVSREVGAALGTAGAALGTAAQVSDASEDSYDGALHPGDDAQAAGAAADHAARAALHQGPTIGLEGSLREVLKVVERAVQAQRPGLLTLVGPPGSGRSRMLYEVAKLARKRFGFQDIDFFEGTSGHLRNAGLPAPAPQNAWNPEDSHLSALIDELPLPAPVNAERGSPLLRHVLGLLQRRHRVDPYLLLIDDADTLSSDARTALLEVLKEPLPIVVLLTIKEATASAGGWPEDFTQLTLETLTARESAALTHGYLNVAQPLPPRLLDAVHHQSGGRPGALVALLEELRTVGVIQHTGNGTVDVDFAKIEAGLTSLDLDASRRSHLSRLNAYALRTLERASVVGRHFFLSSLLAQQRSESQTITPATELLRRARDEDGRIRRVLGELEHQQLIEDISERVLGEVMDRSERVYRFRERRVRQLLYQQQPEEMRTTRHRVVADWAQGHASGTIPNRKLLVALHLDRGRRSKEASAAYFECARDRSEARNPRLALQYLERAISLSRPESVQVRLPALLAYAQKLMQLGQLEKAREAALDAYAIAWRLDADRLVAESLERLAAITYRAGEVEESFSYLESLGSLGLVRGHQEMQVLARTLQHLACLEQGLPYPVEADDQVSEEANTSITCRALLKLWQARRSLHEDPKAPLAIAQLNALRELWSDGSQMHLLALAAETLAEAYLQQGDFARAEKQAELLLSAARDAPDRYLECRSLLLQARILSLTPAAQGLEAVFDSAERIAAELGNTLLLAEVWLGRAYRALKRNEPWSVNEALAVLREQLVHLRTPIVHAHIRLIEARALRQSLVDAAHAAEPAEPRRRASDIPEAPRSESPAAAWDDLVHYYQSAAGRFWRSRRYRDALDTLRELAECQRERGLTADAEAVRIRIAKLETKAGLAAPAAPQEARADSGFFRRKREPRSA